MKHPVTPEQDQLHAYVDGQLDATAQRAVEDYLAENEEARRQVMEYRQINDLLKQLYDPVLEEPIPPALLTPPRRSGGRRLFTQLVAAAALLVIGLSGGFYIGLNQQVIPLTTVTQRDHVVGEAVMAYSVYTPEVRHPVEVSGDQRDHLVSWLSKRMGKPIDAPRLDKLGMRLLGGRLLASDDGPGALLMYEDAQGHRVVLFACHTDEKSSAFRYASEHDVSVFYWVDNTLVYAIAGEIQREQLLPLAESAYNQIVF